MNPKIDLNLGDVQKTLFLPLWGRAVETGKKNPQLTDETAVRIISQVDFDFSKMTASMDDLTKIAWIKRSQICDRVIRRFLTQHPDGTIVNIGCGLDTTYERVDNGTLRWYDLDLPDVIELRSKFVQENERRKFIAASLLESGWLDAIEVKSKVMFIAAGVLYYFEEAQVKGLIVCLLDRFPGSEILFDAASPIGVRVANKKVIESAGLDEKSYLKWGLKSVQDLLAWDVRIRLIGKYYYFRTLRMSLRNILMGALSDSLGIQYMLHLGLG